ncbi:MAG: SBBP repeat-containing protein, partial [Bacteroidales bacterium]|nr:SBBP repeat-containing protein [Bacteroidales bacterium]
MFFFDHQFAYIAGHTTSSNYDITPGAYQTSLAGFFDGFVTKIDIVNNTLIFSTFIGGSAGDYGMSIYVDSLDFVYVGGLTFSSNYPVSSGAFQVSSGGAVDGYITKLTPSGDSLVFSTYIGGWAADNVFAIVVDDSGYVY